MNSEKVSLMEEISIKMLNLKIPRFYSLIDDLEGAKLMIIFSIEKKHQVNFFVIFPVIQYKLKLGN